MSFSLLELLKETYSETSEYRGKLRKLHKVDLICEFFHCKLSLTEAKEAVVNA